MRSSNIWKVLCETFKVKLNNRMAGVRTKLIKANSEDGPELDEMINDFIVEKRITKDSLVDIKLSSSVGKSGTIYDKALVIYEHSSC